MSKGKDKAKKLSAPGDQPAAVATKWSQPVMVCGECRKRTGPDNQPALLRRSLRKELGATKWKRHVRVVETSCLDVCPKRGVAVVIGGRSGAVVIERPSQWPELAAQVLGQIDTTDGRS